MQYGEWYAVHPAFGGLRPQQYAHVPYVSESMVTHWLDSTTDRQHDEALFSYWKIVAAWAGEVGADEIVVDDLLDQPDDFIKSLGFVRGGWWRLRWSWSGSPSGVVERLLKLWDVPTIILTVKRKGDGIVEVRDHSWDSVFVSPPYETAPFPRFPSD